jgi:hypothetical protein
LFDPNPLPELRLSQEIYFHSRQLCTRNIYRPELFTHLNGAAGSTKAARAWRSQNNHETYFHQHFGNVVIRQPGVGRADHINVNIHTGYRPDHTGAQGKPAEAHWRRTGKWIAYRRRGLEDGKERTRLNAEERDMREDNSGKLSAADKAKLTNQQNNLSKGIYQQKHDAQTQPKPANQVNARDRAQQKRIGEGMENGSLTAGEASKLEKKETKLNAEQRDMREDNGGKLTPAEKAKVNGQQNKVSKQIYRAKHNGRHQRG